MSSFIMIAVTNGNEGKAPHFFEVPERHAKAIEEALHAVKGLLLPGEIASRIGNAITNIDDIKAWKPTLMPDPFPPPPGEVAVSPESGGGPDAPKRGRKPKKGEADGDT